MEPKNRQIIVIAIIILIVGAMFTSFGRSLFTLNTPEIVLPSAAGGDDPPAASTPSPAFYQPVSVTPETVGQVVATLSRPDSYYRELTIELFWEDGSSSSKVQVWKDGGWSHICQTTPSGFIRHDIIGGQTAYYWYAGSRQYRSVPADEYSSDLAQHIPTYETVVELDPDDIADADYVSRNDLPCVYVEVQPPGSKLIHRYWVSVDSGLLVSSETWNDGQMIYRMSAYSPAQSPCPESGEFVLPDGTVLHRIKS